MVTGRGNTMTQELQFLANLLPQLLELGVALFARHDGDLTAARRDIRDRRREIEALRAERDAERAAKKK